MEAIITDFYSAFKELDGDKMASFYHKDILFHDPAFGTLKGDHAGNMWRMLCQTQKGKDFKVEFSGIRMDGAIGHAHWEAHYTFSQTGRKVHNKVDTTLEFSDGKILKHTDDFNLHQWATQAMGAKGYLVGWTNFFQKKLNAQTNSLLHQFEQSKTA